MAYYTGGGGESNSTPFNNTNVYSDEAGMPSQEAQNARAKTENILDALRYGKPGEADAMMGKSQRNGDGALRWMKSKLGGKKGKQEANAVIGTDDLKSASVVVGKDGKGDDGVIR